MYETIDYSEADIFIPKATKGYSEDVEHILLTIEEAKAQGWHFRYKSRNRIRITRYTGTAEDIIIPAEISGCRVNDIGERAFYKTDIRKLSVPDTVCKLGAQCFAYCHKLEEVIFADGVEKIPVQAFRLCENLRYVHLPYHTLTAISEEAFYFCRALEYIDIPYRCSSIGKRAFNYTGLKDFSMTNSNVDGTAFEMTPVFFENELLLFRSTYPNWIKIMSVGRNLREKYIKFPKYTTAVFYSNSLSKCNCWLDLTECGDIFIKENAFGDEDLELGYNSVFIKFPEHKMPKTLPHYVESNFFDTVGYHFHDHSAQTETVERETVQLVRHSVDALSLRSIHFHKLSAVSEEPVEVFSRNCFELHEIIWEEDGQLIRKYLPPRGLFSDKSLHDRLLKAFILRRDKETGENLFFDRGVIDSLFKGIRNSRETVLPSRRDKLLIAVDMLRSTIAKGEDSTEMYRHFLLKNKLRAVRLLSKIPEQWSMYKDYLIFFYQLH